MSKSCSGNINKTRYDDLGKPMKQTSFIVKNLGGNLPEKQSTIVKRSFRSSTKLLFLDSTIPVDELTVETFYRFRTSEFFNIWTPPFWCTNPNTWLTSYADPSTQLKHQLEEDVGCKVLQFIQKMLGHKTLRCTNTATSSEEMN